MGSNQALQDQNNLLKTEIDELKKEKKEQSEKFENLIKDLENSRKNEFDQLSNLYNDMRDGLIKENDALLNKFKEAKRHYKSMVLQTGLLINVLMKNINDPNGEIKKDSLIKIYMRSKKVLYGTIRFNYMIPVPPSELQKVTVNTENEEKSLYDLSDYITFEKN